MLMVTTWIGIFVLRRQPVHIIERLTDGAVVEKLHPVGDAYGDDFGEGRAAEDAPAKGRSGENAERAGSVSAIIDRTRRTVGGVIGKIGSTKFFPRSVRKNFGRPT